MTIDGSTSQGTPLGEAVNADVEGADDQLQVPLHPALTQAHALANLVTSEPERFVSGDADVAQLSALAVKQLFDLSVQSEALAVPTLGKFLRSIAPIALPNLAKAMDSLAPQETTKGRGTRSSGKRKRGQSAKSAPPPTDHPLFQPTPLDELVVEGMDSRQLWEQIDLKGFKVQGLLDTVFVSQNGQGDQDDDEDEDADEEAGSDDDDDEDDQDGEVTQRVSLKDLTDADLRALGLDPSKRDQIIFDDDEDDSDAESASEPYAGASDISDGDPNEVYYEPLRTEKEQRRRKEEQEMGMLPRLRSQVQHDGDDEEEEDESEDEAEDEDEDEEMEDGETTQSGSAKQRSILDSLDEPGNGTGAVAGGRGKRHPTLDDDFFSIDEFNRQTEAAEMREATKDAADDDDEDLSNEVDFFRDVDGLGGEDDDAEDDIGAGPSRSGAGMDPSELHFADFFLPPSKAAQFRAKADKKAQKLAAKGKGKMVEAELETGDDDLEDDIDANSDDDSDDEPEEPERKRTIRFNDTVAIRRIKPRKKKRGGAVTPEMLAALGFDEEEAARYAEGLDDEDDGDDDEDEDSDEEMDEDGADEEDEEDEDAFGQSDEDEDAAFDDEAEEEGSGEDEELSDGETQVQTARRVAGDLFADSDDEGDSSADKVSTHEKRLAALQEEISQLEQENVGQKDWTLRGEAGSKIRPQDSLLQEDLEFERTAKVTPQVTEEMTESLEDMIKRRILDRQFDDVVRRRELEALPFLPSRLLELSDSKSAKSLAELYEEEYQAARGAAEGETPRMAEADAKLAKEHDEITQIFDDVFDKLDALSNAHFTPKAPKATIQTLSNAPVVSIEEALPSTSSSATMLAPEEIYERQRHAAALEGDKSEMTPAEKQRLHNTLRKEKRAKNERIDETRRALELAGLRRGGKSAREEKDEAMRKLVGSKGVTVIGKDGSQKKGKEALGKNGKGGGAGSTANGPAEASGSRFKL